MSKCAQHQAFACKQCIAESALIITRNLTNAVYHDDVKYGESLDCVDGAIVELLECVEELLTGGKPQ